MLFPTVLIEDSTACLCSDFICLPIKCPQVCSYTRAGFSSEGLGGGGGRDEQAELPEHVLVFRSFPGDTPGSIGTPVTEKTGPGLLGNGKVEPRRRVSGVLTSGVL